MMKFKVLTSILCLVMAATLLPNLVFAQNEASEETVQLIPEDVACDIGIMSYMTYVRKSMYRGTYLQVILNCPETDEEIKITKVEWRLLSARCFNKLGNTVIDSKTTAQQELQEVCLMLEESPANTLGYSQYNRGFSFKNDQKTTLKCSKDQRNVTFPFDEAKWNLITTTIAPTEATTAVSSTTVATPKPTGPANKTQSRKRRDGHDGPAGPPPDNSGPGAPGSPGAPKSPAPASPGSPGLPSPPQGPSQSGPKASEPNPPNASGKNTSPGGNLPGGNPAAGEPGANKSQEKTLVGNPPAGNFPVNNTEAKGPPMPGSPTSNLVVGIPSSSPAPSTVTTSKPGNKDIPPRGAVLRTESDGVYIFVLVITVESNSVFNYTATITPIARHGHLSAIDFPLLPFYAVMFVVYAIYLIVWLTLCCCYRRDILQVQYWITAVIFLGLLEKTIFLGENDTLNRTGHSSVYGALVFGELMSCAKKTLSRMLVVVVSVGFGIVKPRLGPTLQKVLVVGLVYFIACSVEGGLRVSNDKADITKDTYIPFIVLTVVDAGICYWIFASLVQTMRTLRLRRNLVKLSLYRHFTNTLIFAVIASVAFMLWSIRQHKMTECLTDWKELWVDEAFWHLLFSILLLVIIILWRPSANNQRYAYSHLQDQEDDESEEPMMNTAFDGMKLRSKGQENGTKRRVYNDDETDDDLKWIEENIPTSLADSALPSLLDSDEEIAMTQNELRKLH